VNKKLLLAGIIAVNLAGLTVYCLQGLPTEEQKSVIVHNQGVEMVEIGAIYEHYKGKKYKVLDLARHTDNTEIGVVYESLYDDPTFGHNAHWFRPLNEFVGTLMVDGKEVIRFKKVQNS